MHVVLFEDDQVVNLYPITIGRPAFSISVGAAYFSISMTEGATPDRLAEMFDLVQPNIRIGE